MLLISCYCYILHIFISLLGSLRSATNNDKIFKTWLKNTELENDIGIGISNNYDINNNNNNYYNNDKIDFVEYLPLTNRIVRILEILLENSDGIDNNENNENKFDLSNLNWTFREFELIDLLINQVKIQFTFLSLFIYHIILYRIISYHFRIISQHIISSYIIS